MGTGHIPYITYSLLTHEINSFRDIYSQARDAIYNVFMRPEELKILALPEDILDSYRIYSLEKGNSFLSCMKNRLQTNSPTLLQTHGTAFSWSRLQWIQRK